jgi:2-succinyl-5-enolpyruvyl-6-hydroxy-3-cyclohexene-1-carboxylate synthase
VNATKLARATICQLIELGVQDFVLSPGSRNAPLSIALFSAEQAGLIKLHQKIDERSAAFFALGISKAKDQYVAVVCTSGTAAANYHPAVLEALHGGNKLLIITADRPASLRRTGANQTTNQTNIYGDVKTHDIHEQIDLFPILRPVSPVLSGPIHLNIQFEEPLISQDKEDWLAGIRPIPEDRKLIQKSEIVTKGTGMVIIGHDRGTFTVEEVSEWLASTKMPYISEDPISFPGALPHAALFLSDQQIRQALAPEFIIILGRTTLSRSINSFIAECPTTFVIDPRTQSLDTARSATKLLHSLPSLNITHHDDSYNEKWQLAATLAHEVIESSHDWSEELAVRTITTTLPQNCALYVGSSRPIRDIEAFASPRAGVHVFANRGLAGIDGNISTAFGISEGYLQSYSIIGDITFLHDIGALTSATENNHTIFVINNNGGGIFNTLPQAGVEGFEKLFGTPHNRDLSRLISGFGIPTITVKNVSDLQRSIIHPRTGLGIVLVEVPDRELMAEHLREMLQRVSSAVRIGANFA